MCDLEAAWIALQRGEHARAVEVLAAIAPALPETQLASAHVAFTQGDLPLAFDRVNQLRGQLSVDDPQFPSLIALLGQIYYAGNQWEPALDAMLYALRAFEQRESRVGWSHTCYNLALMYAERGDLSHALQYLRSLPPEYQAE
jgi:tetratricopeptide (TPR) repeat protein